MRHPAVTLQIIVDALQKVTDAGSLNAQQTTFMKLIRDTSYQLLDLVDPMPDSGYAVRRIIPPLAEVLSPKLVALYGYARMLLEFPDSFGGGVLNEAQAQSMTLVYEEGLGLAKDIEQLGLEAFSLRATARKELASDCDLLILLDEHLPIMRYWLRDYPIKVSTDFPRTLPLVRVSHYHLAELIQHILLTLAKELLEFGTIRLSFRFSAELLEFGITCAGMSFDTRQLSLLFGQNGRNLYIERLHQDGGSLRVQPEQGYGATLYIQLPLAESKQL